MEALVGPLQGPIGGCLLPRDYAHFVRFAPRLSIYPTRPCGHCGIICPLQGQRLCNILPHLTLWLFRNASGAALVVFCYPLQGQPAVAKDVGTWWGVSRAEWHYHCCGDGWKSGFGYRGNAPEGGKSCLAEGRSHPKGMAESLGI